MIFFPQVHSKRTHINIHIFSLQKKSEIIIDGHQKTAFGAFAKWPWSKGREIKLMDIVLAILPWGTHIISSNIAWLSFHPSAFVFIHFALNDSTVKIRVGSETNYHSSFLSVQFEFRTFSSMWILCLFQTIGRTLTQFLPLKYSIYYQCGKKKI